MNSDLIFLVGGSVVAIFYVFLVYFSLLDSQIKLKKFLVYKRLTQEYEEWKIERRKIKIFS